MHGALSRLGILSLHTSQSSHQVHREQIIVELPVGVRLTDGSFSRRCSMRRATVGDELESARHALVQAFEGYYTIVLLSRVTAFFGSASDEQWLSLRPEEFMAMCSEDFACLQELYLRLNNIGHFSQVSARCPVCQSEFTLNLAPK